MSGRRKDERDLVEGQGVNAGAPVDREPGPAPPESGPEPAPPDEPGVDAALSDEMAGLPQQRPGHPGQQRSVDTS